MKKLNSSLSILLDKLSSNTVVYFQENAYLINILIIVMIAVYGFELFNFNLTIDEEIHAFYNGPTTAWIAQGRWGMYILNKFLLPYTIVPMVPLLLALTFHLISVFLMLEAWNVKSKLDKVILGIIGITFPTIAYAYTFSTLNYGIGFGLLCVALSAFISSKSTNWIKYTAILPATFSLAIYQGFIPALISIFLVNIISSMMLSEKSVLKDIVSVSFIIVCAMIAYYIIQKQAIAFLGITESGYVLQYLDTDSFFGDFINVLNRLRDTAVGVYFGDRSIYSINIPMLEVLFVTLLFGMLWHLLRSRWSIVKKSSIVLLTACLIALPFSLGIFSQGIMGMRVVVALPIVVPGLCLIGLGDNPRPFKLLLAMVSGFCILQFIVSTNHLFASSFLSLEGDRLLASQLIDEIQEAKAISKIEDPKYLVMVGQLNRPSTELMPKVETFGASFFEWDGGNIGRVVLFLKTIGYTELEFLPAGRQAEFISVAENMPKWPSKGSVRVEKDTVIVKFGDYTYSQILDICNLTPNEKIIPARFCP